MRKHLLPFSLLALLCSSYISNAQYVFTRFNINPGSAHSTPLELASCNNRLYFQATDGTHGIEPWISDGTPAGTKLLKDIHPGGSGSDASSFAAMNGKTYFAASDGNNGKELWVTDGTEAGTKMLADLNPGAASSTPLNLTESGGKIFFQANNGTDGIELWVTDGTVAGTKQLKNINAGSAHSRPHMFYPYNNKIIFVADNGTDGVEPWVSDGTTDGTLMLKDINAGATGSMQAANYPGHFYFIGYNGSVYFGAHDNTHGGELWVTDGTPAGTQLVTDHYPGPQGTDPKYFAIYNGKMYYSGCDTNDMIGDPELFVSDGTAGGTQLLKSLNNGQGWGDPHDLIVYRGKLYFGGTDSALGGELWTSDGTEAGTEIVKDVRPGQYGSVTSALAGYSDKFFFSAGDGVGFEVYISDGTEANTTIIKPGSADHDNPLGGTLILPVIANNTLFYSAWYEDSTGRELWAIRDTTLTTPPPTGVTQTQVFTGFTIAPNPAHDVVSIKVHAEVAGRIITLTDVTGRKIQQTSIQPNGSDAQLQVANLPKGLYFINLYSNGMILSKRFIKD